VGSRDGEQTAIGWGLNLILRTELVLPHKPAQVGFLLVLKTSKDWIRSPLAESIRMPLNFNNGTLIPAEGECIHELFEQQVRRSPDAIAVEFEGQQLTYSQLNGRANQLAHYLRRRGVGIETLAGICVERSLEMIVGLLGILKAGGAYVPLDPAYPYDRLSFMLDDANARVLLTQQALAAGVSELLVKPLQSRQFAATLDRVLHHNEALTPVQNHHPRTIPFP